MQTRNTKFKTMNLHSDLHDTISALAKVEGRTRVGMLKHLVEFYRANAR